jgi:hypothetical protein
MTSRIDPIRRATLMRKAAKADPAAEDSSEAEVVRLPVPLDRASRILPRAPEDSHAAFAAQLMGQDGQKRGLRAGPELFDAAKATYNRTEYSGANDRRAPKGAKAKTEI